jgi:uncharacterized protein with von Willebrand factor type A (vWA) domain
MGKPLPTRRTPCVAVLEHLTVIDELLVKIREKLEEDRKQAQAGTSIWADAGSMSHTREQVQNIAESMGIPIK